MFYDMALLVDEQGEMIDHIEHNVENAAVHVEIGRKEVRVAVQFQRKNRKVGFDLLKSLLSAYTTRAVPWLLPLSFTLK